MIYGYARCSTSETKQDINRQKRDLKAMGAEEIYYEYESGTKLERPELNKLLRIIQPGDTLAVTEVSRITRSTRQLCEIVELAKYKKLRLVIGTFVVDCCGELNPMTEGMIQMMGIFAQMERNIIADRVKSGLKNARAKGIKLGRPTLRVEDIPAMAIKHFGLYQDGHITKTEYASLCGVAVSTIYRYISVLTDM